MVLYKIRKNQSAESVATVLIGGLSDWLIVLLKRASIGAWAY